MKKALIIYETKYGSTKEIAEKLALILGPAAVIKPSGFSEKYMDFDYIVIGSPLYEDKILPEVDKFIKEHSKWLKTKKIALFTVGLSRSSPYDYWSEIIEQLADSVLWVESFGGIMNPAVLDHHDEAAIKQFSEYTAIQPVCSDERNDTNLVEKALNLKRLLRNTRNMPQNELMKHIEDYLSSHNTCTLCTSHNYETRATPIEYCYINGVLYFFSEGGEKFSHILVNPLVSVAVYDNFKSFKDLNGLQIKGKAEIIPFNSAEYERAAAIKGLDIKKLAEMQVKLNLLKVTASSFEFLSSEISFKGYDIKQSIDL